MSPTNPNEPGWLEEQLIILADVLGMIPGILALGSANQEGRIQALRQSGLRLHRPGLLSFPELSELQRRGALPDGAMYESLARQGYPDRTIGIMQSLVPALFDAQTLGELSRRKLIDDQDYNRRLASLGYGPLEIEHLRELRLFIPGPSDVISFANRDVYYPDVVQAYGMDQDFPEAMIPDLERAGVPRETALKYWEAHWALPSMQQAFEMLQRDAETGLTDADINRLMRSAGVEPYWRPKLLAISYAPYTRVDIRRMHKLGILSESQVTRAYQDIGYNKERAEQLTKFTVELNKHSDNESLAPFQTKFRTLAEGLYLDGVISADELHAQFKELGFSDDEASAFVAEAEFIRHANEKKTIRTAIQRAYEQGHITAEEASTRLVADGYSTEEVARIMQTWHIVRELHDESVHTLAAKELTKAEVLTAYVDGIINEDDARAHLKALRYSDHDADTEIQLATFRKSKADRTAAEHTQHSLYISRRVDDAAASKSLVQAGVSPERIAQLLAEWRVELVAHTPTLTKAEIAHAVAQEFMDPSEGVARLQQMGYAHDDVTIIIELASKGVVVV